MTSCVAIVVPEGIALASDSLASENGNPHLTIKLLPIVIGKTEYGVCISGQEKLNGEPVLSIFDSLAKSFAIENPSFMQITNYFSNGLMEQLKKKYQKVDIKIEKLSKVTFLLCGFEEKNIKKPIVVRCKIFGKKVTNKPVAIYHEINLMNSDNSLGAFAIGSYGHIKEYISDENNNSSNDSPDLTTMSLKDAIKHAEYLVGIMCDKDRKHCGGPIRSAALRPDGFNRHHWD